MIHNLKIHPKYFEEVKSSKKSFEFRNNDRDYKEGDLLILQEYEPDTKTYTGQELECRVVCILNIQSFVGLDYVVLGIKLIDKT